MATPEFRAHVDRLLPEGNLGLALAPRLDDASPGASQIAMNVAQKAFVKSAMRLTGADKGFDRTINSMTGGQFSPGDIRTLEDRLLDKAEWRKDTDVLQGIAEGPPVYLRPDQKAVIDRLIGGLGADHLAQRAQAAYQKAIDAGQVRTR
jgi:hypothetical protein